MISEDGKYGGGGGGCQISDDSIASSRDKGTVQLLFFYLSYQKNQHVQYELHIPKACQMFQYVATFTAYIYANWYYLGVRSYPLGEIF
jgi:hypothetical protein